MAHLDHLRDARDAVDRASESADGETHEQLNSVERVLSNAIDGATDDSDPGDEALLQPDRLAELERKLSGLTAEEEEHPDAQQDVEDALDALDDYRREVDPEDET